MKLKKVKALALPPKSPNLNAYAERWVRSVKEECLSRLILFGERSLKRALHHYELHYHEERNHQGKDNLLLVPALSQLLDADEFFDLTPSLAQKVKAIAAVLLIAAVSAFAGGGVS